MRTSFGLPSCNYTIILSKEELEKLDAGEVIVKESRKVESTFINEKGYSFNNCNNLKYVETRNSHPIQFIRIVIDNKED